MVVFSQSFARTTVRALRHASKRGFTLIEVMLVFTLLGGLAALIVPTVNGIMENHDRATAKARAAGVSAAKAIYLRENGTAGVESWEAAGGDADRFLLLRDVMGSASAGAELSGYLPEGYSLTLGASNDEVELWQGSTRIAYLK